MDLKGEEVEQQKPSIAHAKEANGTLKHVQSSDYCLSEGMLRFISENQRFDVKLQLLESFLVEVLENSNIGMSKKLLWIILVLYFKYKGNLKSSKLRNTLITLLQTGEINILGRNFILFSPLTEEENIGDSLSKDISISSKSNELDEICEILGSGDKEKALFMCCEYEMWPLCFLIGQQIGPKALQTVSKRYLKQKFTSKSRLKLLIQVGAEIDLDFDTNLRTNWRNILLSLLSSKSKYSFINMKKLGDKLLSCLGDTSLAHCCYLLSSLPLRFSKTSRVVLFSLNHKKRTFRSVFEFLEENSEGVTMTEIVVQTMRLRQMMKLKRGGSVSGSVNINEESMFSIRSSKTFNTRASRPYDKDKHISFFQPFRLAFLSQMMKRGKTEEAKQLMKTILSELKLISLSEQDHLVIKTFVLKLVDTYTELKEEASLLLAPKRQAPTNEILFSQKPTLEVNGLINSTPLATPLSPQLFTESTISESNETSQFFKQHSNSDGQTNWTNPFAKPAQKPKVLNQTRSPAPAPLESFRAETPTMQRTLTQNTSFADTEDVLTRPKSVSITDPFAVSTSRRPSYNSEQSPTLSGQARPRRLSSQNMNTAANGFYTQPVPIASNQSNNSANGFYSQQQAPMQLQQQNHQPMQGFSQQPTQGFPQQTTNPTASSKVEGQKKGKAVKGDGFIGRMKNRLLRALVPVGDNAIAVEKGLGSSLEGYYDEQLKRWVFPTDDPNAVDNAQSSAGPPPTSLQPPMTTNTSQQEPSDEKAKIPDMLSQMTQPARRKPLGNRNRTTNRSKYVAQPFGK